MTSNDSYIEKIKLSELARIISPKKTQLDTSGNTPYLNIEYLEKGICNRYVQDNPNTDPNDIIIVADGYRSGMVLKGEKGWLGSTLRAIRIHSSSQISSQYLYYYLSFVTLDRDLFQYGSTIRHLNTTLLKSIEVLVPSPERQQVICNEISRYEKKYDYIRKCIFRIEHLLDAITYKDKKSIIQNNNTILLTLDNIWVGKLNSTFSQLR